MKHKNRANYEAKFADFIELCQKAKSEGVQTVIVAAPWVIGDTYDEVIESLSRLAKADLALKVASPDSESHSASIPFQDN
jgi:hypothetical protein